MKTRFASLSFLLALLTLLPWSPAFAQAPLPFLDDFSDKNPTDGSPVSWLPANDPAATHSADDGDYHIESDSAVSVALADGSKAFGDVSIRTVFRWREDRPAAEFQYIGVVARATADGNSFYYAGMTTTGFVSVGTWGPYQDSGGPLTALDPRTMDVDMQFDVIGNKLSLWAWSDSAGIPKPALPQATMTASLRSTGYVGMAYNSTDGAGEMTYRHFEVAPEPSGLALAVGACCLAAGSRTVQRHRRERVRRRRAAGRVA